MHQPLEYLIKPTDRGVSAAFAVKAHEVDESILLIKAKYGKHITMVYDANDGRVFGWSNLQLKQL